MQRGRTLREHNHPASWFVLGPLLGRPGFCFLTGIQHWLWAREGRTHQPSSMSCLVERSSGRPLGVRSTRAIKWATQPTLYLLN